MSTKVVAFQINVIQVGPYAPRFSRVYVKVMTFKNSLKLFRRDAAQLGGVHRSSMIWEIVNRLSNAKSNGTD